jgi:hypothetical protein
VSRAESLEERWRREVEERQAQDRETIVRAVRRGCVPVDEVRCPICGGELKWSCDMVGWADCQDGMKVSRRWPGTTATPCDWAGTRIVRLNNEVFAELPIQTKRIRPAVSP